MLTPCHLQVARLTCAFAVARETSGATATLISAPVTSGAKAGEVISAATAAEVTSALVAGRLPADACWAKASVPSTAAAAAMVAGVRLERCASTSALARCPLSKVTTA